MVGNQTGRSNQQYHTMAFEAVCDELRVDNVVDTYRQVDWTIGTYRRYLTGYRKALEKKLSEFNLVSADKTELRLGKPNVRAWKVLPRNVIKINDSNVGWYCCPDLPANSLEVGDVINVDKGKEGRRTLTENNFRKKGQYRFKFPELENTRSVIVDGETYRAEPLFDSIPDTPDVSVGGRKVDCEKRDDSTLAIYCILNGPLTLNGKNVDYELAESEATPRQTKTFEEGYLIFSSNKPSSKSKDVTDTLLSRLTPSELMIGDKLLSDLGFKEEKHNIFVSTDCEFIEEKNIIPAEYPELTVPAYIHRSKGHWYRIEMPKKYDTETSLDPRMRIFEDNAIILHGKKKLAVKNKNLDDMMVEFFEYADTKEKKSADLGKSVQITVKFDTRDINNQLSAMDSLKKNPPLELAPLINMFRKSEGQGNWPNYAIENPKYGWRVLYDESFNGVTEQRKFVRKALSTTDFAILDGPPGTGKTTAIRELIIQLILDGKRVLVASSTNAAIDNVLDRIVNIDCKNPKNRDFKEALRPIRLGFAEKASDDVKDYSMENMILENRSSEMDDGLLKRTLINSSNLVCGTIAKVYSDLIVIPRDDDEWKRKLAVLPVFDYMIMDESSKTTFQEFIVPAKLAKRWILAGDIRQLSPFTDEGAVETALDLFSGHETDLNVHPITKTAVAMINECKLIIRYDSDVKRAIIVPDDVAKEIGVQLEKLDSKITENQSVIYDEPESYSDIYSDVYSVKILYIGKTLFDNRRSIIPLDCHVIDLSNGSLNVLPENFHDAWAQDIGDDEKRAERERRIKEDIDNLKKSWAEGIAWRLNRDFWLRNLRKRKSTYIDEIKERIPGEFDTEEKRKKFMKQCIWVVQDVVFHSILELLTVRNRYNDRSLVQSFESDELKRRSESLIYQHRMHEDISKTPAKEFYNDNLKNGPRVNDTGTNYYLGGAKDKHNLWIDCKGRDNKNVNEKEIDLIEKHLRNFIEWAKTHPRPDGEEYSVIVLTFYLAQSNRMKEKLDALKKEAKDVVRIKIATVDYIQGQEADIVFLSMVRNNKVGFMDTPNRLNVAITRSKHLQIFVGNREFFEECKSTELNRIVGGCDCIPN